MKKLYFVRHGLSEMNVLGFRAGSIETPLTDKGRAVAKLAGEHARNLGIDLIVSSSMGRALETAEIIAREISYPLEAIQKSDLLVERHFGILEGKPYKPGEDLDVVEGIEQAEALFERVTQALDWIETLPGNTVLIVSHGATGRALRHVLDPNISFASASFNNAEIVELRP